MRSASVLLASALFGTSALFGVVQAAPASAAACVPSDTHVHAGNPRNSDYKTITATGSWFDCHRDLVEVTLILKRWTDGNPERTVASAEIQTTTGTGGSKTLRYECGSTGHYRLYVFGRGSDGYTHYYDRNANLDVPCN